MDFNWMPYWGSFWLLPLLCLVFMGVVMMLVCRGMAAQRGHGAGCCGPSRTGSPPQS